MSSELIINDNASLQEMRSNTQKYPRLSTIPAKVAMEQLMNIVGTAFMFTGRKAEAEDVTFIASNLYESLMLDESGLGMRGLSMGEISRAIKKSVLGQGREMYGLSVSSFYSAIADYCRNEGHIIDKQLRDEARRKNRTVIDGSVISPMLTTYAGMFKKNHTI